MDRLYQAIERKALPSHSQVKTKHGNPPGPAERGHPRNLGSHSGCGLCRLIHSLSGATPPCVVDDGPPSACCLRILAWSASGRLSQGCPQGILSVCFLSALLQHAHLDTNGIKLLKGQEDRSWFLTAGKSLLSIVHGIWLNFPV